MLAVVAVFLANLAFLVSTGLIIRKHRLIGEKLKGAAAVIKRMVHSIGVRLGLCDPTLREEAAAQLHGIRAFGVALESQSGPTRSWCLMCPEAPCVFLARLTLRSCVMCAARLSCSTGLHE